MAQRQNRERDSMRKKQDMTEAWKEHNGLVTEEQAAVCNDGKCGGDSWVRTGSSVQTGLTYRDWRKRLLRDLT